MEKIESILFCLVVFLALSINVVSSQGNIEEINKKGLNLREHSFFLGNSNEISSSLENPSIKDEKVTGGSQFLISGGPIGLSVIWPEEGYYYITDFMFLQLETNTPAHCKYNFEGSNFVDMDYTDDTNHFEVLLDLQDNMASVQPYESSFQCSHSGNQESVSTYFWINTTPLDNYFIRNDFGNLNYIGSEIIYGPSDELNRRGIYGAYYGQNIDTIQDYVIISIYDDEAIANNQIHRMIHDYYADVENNVGSYSNAAGNGEFWKSGNKIISIVAEENEIVDSGLLTGYLSMHPPTVIEPCEGSECDIYNTPSIDDDAILGEINAPITIIEFGGYQDPFSRLFWENTLPEIKSNYIDTGKVRYVFRDFPLNTIHPLAQLTAEAAECVGEQGGNEAYYDMQDLLFSNQGTLSEALVKQLAQSLGYNINDCLNSRQMENEVDSDYSDGLEAGVMGTPTFFINDEVVSGAYPLEVFENVIDGLIEDQIECYEDSECGESTEDFYCNGNGNACSSSVSYTCIDPGTIESRCLSYSGGSCGVCQFACYSNSQTSSCIMCDEDIDCNDGQDNTVDLCMNPGMLNSQCIHESVPITLLVNSPSQDLFNERRISFNLSVNEEVDEINYIDWSDIHPRERRLCRNCDEYGLDRIRYKTFADGFHNITFKAIKDDENVDEKTVAFRTDSRDPRISSSEPRRGFASGVFNVKFREDNPLQLNLLYGNRSKEVNLDSECLLNRGNYECETQVDLMDFDGGQIEYHFELTDIVGNIDMSRMYELDVDATPPILNDLNYVIDRRRVDFTFNVSEDNFDEIDYTDWSDTHPRKRRLCSRLRDGICEVRKSFRVGEHNLTISVVDDAGNSVEETIEFNID